MTPLAIISIIYLAINVVGTVIGFVWLCTTIEFLLINKLLISNSKRWVRIVLSSFEIMLLVLFIPTVTVLALTSLVSIIIGSNFGE